MSYHCMIAEVKFEFQHEYIDAHKNPWPELLTVIKDSGIKEEIIYFHKNQTIIFFKCNDEAPLDKCVTWQKQTEIVKKWDVRMAPMFSSEFVFPEEIFDLNKQYEADHL